MGGWEKIDADRQHASALSTCQMSGMPTHTVPSDNCSALRIGAGVVPLHRGEGGLKGRSEGFEGFEGGLRRGGAFKGSNGEPQRPQSRRGVQGLQGVEGLRSFRGLHKCLNGASKASKASKGRA